MHAATASAGIARSFDHTVVTISGLSFVMMVAAARSTHCPSCGPRSPSPSSPHPSPTPSPSPSPSPSPRSTRTMPFSNAIHMSAPGQASLAPLARFSAPSSVSAAPDGWSATPDGTPYPSTDAASGNAARTAASLIALPEPTAIVKPANMLVVQCYSRVRWQSSKPGARRRATTETTLA